MTANQWKPRKEAYRIHIYRDILYIQRIHIYIYIHIYTYIYIYIHVYIYFTDFLVNFELIVVAQMLKHELPNDIKTKHVYVYIYIYIYI